MSAAYPVRRAVAPLADERRIAACLKACVGIPTTELEKPDANERVRELLRNSQREAA